MSDIETKDQDLAEQYPIHSLLKEDQKAIAAMLGRLADEFDQAQIRDIISSARASDEGEGEEGTGPSDEDRKARVIEVFFTLFRRCMSNLTGDVELWLAGLIGKTPEEYQKLPFDIDICILNQVKEAPEVERFFTGALHLFRMTEALKSAWSQLKGAYDSASDAVRESSTG